jgi:hypothetical protein
MSIGYDGRVRWALVFCVAGCRLGFGETGSNADASDSPTADAFVFVPPTADAPPNAQTYVFGEAPAATHTGVTTDTYLSQDNESGDERPNNFGGDEELKIKQGEEHGLIRFDIQAIPSSATVFSATLTLHVTGFDPATVVEIRPLLETWVEGNLNGTPGHANWNERDATPTAWTTVGAAPPGSAGPVATTFEPAALGSITIALPAALVQPWLNGAMNHGMLFIVPAALDGSSIDVTSREVSPSSTRPTLAVTFVP